MSGYGGNLLIRNGTLILPHSRPVKADVKIVDGRVEAIGKSLSGEGVDEVINAEGLIVMPGVVDEHVHMREPGLEYKDDFTHGTMGAALAGVTTVLEMPNTKPPVENSLILKRKAELLSGKAFVDFGLYGVIHDSNIHEFEDMVNAGAVGFKIFLGPTTGNIPPPDDGSLYDVMTRSARRGVTLAFHAESADLVKYFTNLIRGSGRSDPAAHEASRPPICEEVAISKLIVMSRRTGGRVHIVHMSAKEGVELLRMARAGGLKVTGETCPHYLLLSSKDYSTYGTSIKVNPPIRGEEHREALWRGVLDGTITALGSDHAPHAEWEKKGNVWECAAGFTGVQTFLPLMLHQALTGKLPINKIPELMSEEPAKLFRIWPRKGSLQPGSDGDAVIIDPKGETEVTKEWIKAKYPITPFIGWRLKGRIKYVILRGHVIAKDYQLITLKPIGKWVRPDEEPD